MRLWGRFSALGLVDKLIAVAVVAAVCVSAYLALDWWFDDSVKNRAKDIVAEEQGEATLEAGRGSTTEVIKRYEYYRHTERVVDMGQGEVDDAWKGESVGTAVDAAGATALCRLHDDLCRRSESPPL